MHEVLTTSPAIITTIKTFFVFIWKYLNAYSLSEKELYFSSLCLSFTNVPFVKTKAKRKKTKQNKSKKRQKKKRNKQKKHYAVTKDKLLKQWNDLPSPQTDMILEDNSVRMINVWGEAISLSILNTPALTGVCESSIANEQDLWRQAIILSQRMLGFHISY